MTPNWCIEGLSAHVAAHDCDHGGEALVFCCCHCGWGRPQEISGFQGCPGDGWRGSRPCPEAVPPALCRGCRCPAGMTPGHEPGGPGHRRSCPGRMRRPAVPARQGPPIPARPRASPSPWFRACHAGRARPRPTPSPARGMAASAAGTRSTGPARPKASSGSRAHSAHVSKPPGHLPRVGAAAFRRPPSARLSGPPPAHPLARPGRDQRSPARKGGFPGPPLAHRSCRSWNRRRAGAQGTSSSASKLSASSTRTPSSSSNRPMGAQACRPGCW